MFIIHRVVSIVEHFGFAVLHLGGIFLFFGKFIFLK